MYSTSNIGAVIVPAAQLVKAEEYITLQFHEMAVKGLSISGVDDALGANTPAPLLCPLPWRSETHSRSKAEPLMPMRLEDRVERLVSSVIEAVREVPIDFRFKVLVTPHNRWFEQEIDPADGRSPANVGKDLQREFVQKAEWDALQLAVFREHANDSVACFFLDALV